MQLRPTARAAQLVTVVPDGRQKVRVGERAAVERAIAELPKADRALLAKHGLKVQLVPKASLEDGMLGATRIVRATDGTWTPTTIRVASRLGGRRGVDSIGEVAQHEIGHALAVIRRQDRSEDAAHAYAAKH